MSYVNGVATLLNEKLLFSGKVIKGEAECLDIEIKGTYVIVKTDHKDFTEGVINTIYKSGQQISICDYVIVSDTVILVCELKSNNEGKMKTQLKNTGKFVQYLLAMVKEHGAINANIPPIKYVFFGKMYREGKRNVIANKLSRIPWQESELFKLSCNSIYHLKQFN